METEVAMARDRAGWEMTLLMGTGFHFGVMNVLELDSGDRCITL